MLEHEEGREVVGLLLLLAHVVRMSSVMADRARGGSGDGGASGGMRVGHVAITAGLTFALLASVYVWYYYQPKLNARYTQSHCSGLFHSPDGAGEGGAGGAETLSYATQS